MLGREVQDPEHTESDLDQVMGLGLIDSITIFEANKVTHQVIAAAGGHRFLGINFSGDNLQGYEIHMGRTKFLSEVEPAFTIETRSGEQVRMADGAVTPDGLVMGTYIHGIFDNDEYRRAVLDALRVRKGLAPLGVILDTQARKDAAYNRLAGVVRQSMDMDLVYRIMNENNGR